MKSETTNIEKGVARASEHAQVHSVDGAARLAFLVLLIVAGFAIGRAQSPGVPPPSQSPIMHGELGRVGGGFSDNEDVDPVMMERRMRALNMERQKQMVSDTNKLLKLAKELNDEVATSNVGSFTPDQLRKIAEIEKLARNVKDRMTAGIGQVPTNLPPPPGLIYPGRPQ